RTALHGLWLTWTAAGRVRDLHQVGDRVARETPFVALAIIGGAQDASRQDGSRIRKVFRRQRARAQELVPSPVECFADRAKLDVTQRKHCHSAPSASPITGATAAGSTPALEYRAWPSDVRHPRRRCVAGPVTQNRWSSRSLSSRLWSGGQNNGG